jgi:hypothetical protein
MEADVYQRALQLLALAFVLSTIPAFFAIYRDAAFQTSPRDDYAPSLLALVGERGAPPDRQPTLLGGAPFGYRVLSVAAAIPFYELLPYYSFSNLPVTDEHYLRATAALSMVSYLSILLTVLVVYGIARRRLKCSPGASLLTALMSFGLFQFMSTSGVDPLAVAVVALLVYFLDRPMIFGLLIIASAAMNEKVVIIFAVVFAVRVIAWLVGHHAAFRYWPQTLATGVAVLAYALMHQLLQLPGNEGKTDTRTWFAGAAATLGSSLSVKGVVQNGIPLVVIAVLLSVAYATWRLRRDVPGFSPLDLAVAPVLLAIGLIIDVQFTLGRLVMHSFPLYLPLVAFVIDDFVIKRDPNGAGLGQQRESHPAVTLGVGSGSP